MDPSNYRTFFRDLCLNSHNFVSWLKFAEKLIWNDRSARFLSNDAKIIWITQQ